jgi:hypothetical protein
MKIIDWSRFNYDTFTHFCNALLSFEYGNEFIPFSAQGKDGGVDGQLMRGSDNWRFQYKFKTTPARTALSNLRTDLKNEFSKLTPDVTHYFLLTNVELLPNSIVELTNLWNEISDGKVFIEIWDGARLNTKIIAYPLLRLWLDEGFGTSQLSYYRDYFSLQLATNDSVLPISLTNYYIKNQNLEDVLFEFIKSNKIIFNLIGEAGLGKTRAIIEFFTVLESSDERWVLLVLNNHNLNYDSIIYALSGEGNHLILIDDSHIFEDKTVLDLFSIANRKKNVKLLLTTRPIGEDRTYLPLKEIHHDLVESYQISPLSISETKEFFLHYLGNSSFKPYIDEFVTFSHGKPIVIVAMINALNNRKQITELKNSAFLKNYVLNYFKQFADNLNLKLGYPPVKTLNVISILALIEPIRMIDSDDLSQISEMTDLKIEDVEEIFYLLKKERIVDGKSSVLIKPDIYSDILLSEVNIKKLAKYIDYFKNKINNILVNLSSSTSNNETENVLIALSEVYLSSIYNLTDRFSFLNLSSTIYKIGGYFPTIAQGLIEKYIEQLNDSKSIFSVELQELNEKKNVNSSISHIAISEISRHLSALLLNSVNYSFVFNTVIEIQKRYDVSSIFNSIYQFSKVDYYTGFKMSRQDNFLEQLKLNKKDFSRNEVLLIVQILSSFLKLEFMITESSLDRLSVNMSTFRVPRREEVKIVRKKTIEFLLKLFIEENENELRLIIVKNIIDIPREIFSNYKKEPSYSGKDEINSVLSFLLEILPILNISERNLISEQSQFFQLWDKSNEHTQLLEELKDKLSANSLTELLINVLTKNFDFDRKKSYDEVRDETIKRTEILLRNNPTIIAKALIEAHEIKGNKINNLYIFTQQLILKETNFLVEFYNVLKENDSFLFSRIAPDILRKLRNVVTGKEIYNYLVNEILDFKNSNMNNIFLKIFSSSAEMNNKEISDSEISFIKNVLEEKDEKNGYEIAELIPTIVGYDNEFGRTVAINFFEYCHQSNAEYTFMYLQRFESNYLLIRELVLKHTFRFSLSYEIEIALNSVLKNDGVEVLIDYFNERFSKLISAIKTKKLYENYLFVPPNHSSALFEDVEEIRPKLFLCAINWFLRIEESNTLYFARPIFEYLSDSNELSFQLQEVIKSLSNESKSNFETQNRLLIVLQEFIAQDEEFINLILKIFENGVSANSSGEALEDFKSNAYVALTNTGVKIGTPGEPFSQDVLLIDILKRKIANYSQFNIVHKLLISAINSVQSSIDRSNADFNNDTWI